MSTITIGSLEPMTIHDAQQCVSEPSCWTKIEVNGHRGAAFVVTRMSRLSGSEPSPYGELIIAALKEHAELKATVERLETENKNWNLDYGKQLAESNEWELKYKALLAETEQLNTAWFEEVINELRQEDRSVGMFAANTDKDLAFGIAESIHDHFTTEPMSKQQSVETIDIVFDGPPGNNAGRFVEVENGAGKGISVGQWLERPDGYWVLRLPAFAMLPHNLLAAEVSPLSESVLSVRFTRPVTTDEMNLFHRVIISARSPASTS